MTPFVVYSVVLFCILVAITAATQRDGFRNGAAEKWWERTPVGYPAYENFTEAPLAEDTVAQDKEDPLLQYGPDTPSPVDLHNQQPYHLLNDSMQPPRLQEALSCVNSRACYATDFQRMIEKTGNFRQLTNNYKRDYPDSCTAPLQELVLNFYKHEAIPVPPNHTG